MIAEKQNLFVDTNFLGSSFIVTNNRSYEKSMFLCM